MWLHFLKCFFLTVFFTKVSCGQDLVKLALAKKDVVTTENYVFWPNATVPFYVNPDNFDHEQSLAILQALSMFAFRTCLKIAPVMAPPASNEHVLVLENQAGIRRCVFDTVGHSVFEPHRVVIGYDCLKSPEIDMVIMRSLGFPFEHNRINRDVYIDVLQENIETGSIDLFTKEASMPIELRAIPYDLNSVMHFGPRDFSKNGHRTILFKDHTMQQTRLGLTKLDLRKIEVVYGPHCRARDRQERIELCQSYPGVARKKREIEPVGSNLVVSTNSDYHRKKREIDDVEIVTRSLRVNPEITPPPDAIQETLKVLGIDEAVQDVVERVYKVSSLALKNARLKYCNNTQVKPDLRTIDEKDNKNDILGIIELIAHHAQGIVDHAVANLTEFCEESETVEMYQRARCSWNDGSDRCRQSYRSTNVGNIRYSTQHRPTYFRSTNIRNIYDSKNIYGRSGNSSDTDETTTETLSRSKRDDKEAKKDNENHSVEMQSHKDDDHGHDIVKETDKKDHSVEMQSYKDNQENAPDKEGNSHEKETETKKENNGNKKDDKKEKDENGRENVSEKDILNASTIKPPVKLHRHEVRRHARSSRSSYPKDDEMELSSLSIEDKIPKTKQREPRQQHREVKGKKLGKEKAKEETYRQVKKQQRVPSVNKYPKRFEKKSNRHEPKEEKQEESSEKLKIEYSDLEERKFKPKTTTERGMKLRTKRTERREKKEETSDTREETSIEDKRKETREEKRKESSEDEEIEKATERHQMWKPQRSEVIPQIVTLSKANLEFYEDRKWPGGVVRYVIQEDTTYDTNDLRRRIEEVNSILKRKTCVRLKELTEDQAKNVEDYVVIDNSADYVTGRVGGKQRFGSIELFRGDQHRQHTAMMVMAMLGFYFEVSRHDRDKYVRVHMRHVRPDKLHHFEKIRKDATLPLPYDYKSATHPAWQYWRQIGKTGISTVATFKQQDPDGSVMKAFGQNFKLLSDIDIVKINSVYGNKCLKNKRSSPEEKKQHQYNQ